MSEGTDRLPGEFAAMIEKAGLKPWAFMVAEAKAFDPSRLRLSAVFFHAAWSGKSLLLLRELRKKLDRMGPADAVPSLVVIDVETVQSDQAQRWFASAPPEWGETAWIQDGRILGRFTRHSSASDVDSFLEKLADTLTTRHQEEESARSAHHQEEHALHELHELPETTLKIPGHSGQGPGFVA